MTSGSDSRPGPSTTGDPIGAATARAPGVCGVLAQGVLGRHAVFSNLPGRFLLPRQGAIDRRRPGSGSHRRLRQDGGGGAADAGASPPGQAARRGAGQQPDSPRQGPGEQHRRPVGGDCRDRPGAGPGTEPVRHRADRALHRAVGRGNDAGPGAVRPPRRNGARESGIAAPDGDSGPGLWRNARVQPGTTGRDAGRRSTTAPARPWA